MSPFDSQYRFLAGLLHERLAVGDAGKTFLAGFVDGVPAFALAAGLRGTEDHERFFGFARYVSHQRFSCDRVALMWPAEADGEPIYVVEVGSDGDADARLIDGRGAWREHPGGELLVGALHVPGGALPGIERREFDQVFDTLSLPLPAGWSKADG